MFIISYSKKEFLCFKPSKRWVVLMLKIREFIFQILWNVLITPAKKKDNVIIAITSSNFILRSLFGCTTWNLFYALFLSYIKSNHIASTVKQHPMICYFSLLYAKTLTGKLNQDLKAYLNRHPSICHSIQIWIRLMKLYFHEMTKLFHSKICFNVYNLQKFYLNEKLNLYYHI